MRISKLAIAAATVAAAAAVGVTIWKRAGQAAARPPANGTDDLGRFWAKDDLDDAKPVHLADR